ncbi:centrosomal protein of 55 kDa [Pelobates fuscus]|uniref:centrosomal protein of 55 kDa n=1 Tax=Pelobates fuscus TaxID=191477 RepID=UPI002FE4EAFF
MNTKILSNKLGIKTGPTKPDPEMEKLKKENAALKKTLDEMSKSKGKMSDVEKKKLLEKILELETLKVKNAQEITKQYQEIENLKHALKSKLNDQVSTAETDAKTMANLAQSLRNPAPAITTSQQNPQKMKNQGADANVDILQVQLKDALEKNQQWLSYDQQRETYVQGLMARIYELEQQVAAVNQTLQQQVKESSDAKQDDKQKYYDKLLLTAKKDLEEEQKLVAQLNAELATTRTKYEEKKKEVEELSVSVQLVREDEKQLREDERKRVKDKIQRLKIELELCRNKVVEEKNRSSELLNRVQAMQQSLLKNQEDEERVISLEQQIQRCTSDFENEKIDRQKVQHQLHKVLKELRKAREQITRLEPTKHLHDVCYIDSSKNFHTEFDEKLSMREQYPSPKHRSPLDESFLECPKCKAIYPTSEHRELLAHIDYCTS